MSMDTTFLRHCIQSPETALDEKMTQGAADDG